MESVGQQVRARRKAKGWSQKWLAQEAGLTKTTIANIERGDGARTTNLEKIAEALGVDVRALFEEVA